MNRIELVAQKFGELFGKPSQNNVTDPEFMEILQRFIFGQVFYTGNIDDKMRELITLSVLTVMQTLPQLKAHTFAALNIGLKPVEIRESIYQCAPFIGFPRTLNAIGIMNEALSEQGIELPLEKNASVEDSERYEKGKEIQEHLYGNEIEEKYRDMPGNLGKSIASFLTEFCFGDFYTRNAINVKTRELLILCILAELGSERQISAHCKGNLKVGNNLETQYSALIHCIPYIGFPAFFRAIDILLAEIN